MLLTVSDVTKTYRTSSSVVEVLRGASLSLDAGETLALMGESGSGKSTLLHLIGGLDISDGGVITLDGVQVNLPSDSHRAKLRAQKVGIIFQQFNLIPSLTVSANIAFQAQMAGRYDAVWCDTLARRIGLSEQLGKYPEALSGGQQQRVAIARALAARPALILADEPTGNLDETTADIVLQLLIEIAAETGTALLMVTHSAHHAQAMQRQLTLSGGVIAT
ncbi:MAG: ABC transporter ATP-binding protein [Pseudomonadota bacterium]